MNTDLDKDSEQFWSLLFQIVLDGEKRLAAHLAAHNLTPPQFYVLKTLSEQGGSYAIGQIARQHHLTNATMTGLVNRLEAMTPPLVERQQHKHDRRSIYVHLTAEGEARFEAVQNDFVEQIRAILSLLNPPERETLLLYLSQYVEVVAQQFPVAPIES